MTAICSSRRSSALAPCSCRPRRWTARRLFVQTRRGRASGRGRPYVIPESGSNELGAFGYAAAVEELQAQIAAGVLAPSGRHRGRCLERRHAGRTPSRQGALRASCRDLGRARSVRRRDDPRLRPERPCGVGGPHRRRGPGRARAPSISWTGIRATGARGAARGARRRRARRARGLLLDPVTRPRRSSRSRTPRAGSPVSWGAGSSSSTRAAASESSRTGRRSRGSLDPGAAPA